MPAVRIFAILMSREDVDGRDRGGLKG